MATVKDLWSSMVTVGYNVRKTGLDGLAEWQPYKTKFGNATFYGKKKLALEHSFKTFCDGLEYLTTDADHSDAIVEISSTSRLDNKIENHHFIIQHFRLAKMENFELTVLRLAQLAYNVGQAKAEFEMAAYDDEVISFYAANNLSNLQTYMKSLYHLVPVSA